MRRPNGESSIPPVEKTLARVVVLMRWLGWAWMLILVAVGWVEHPEASRAVLLIAATVGTAQMWLILAATRRGFLGKPWFVVLDGAVSFFLMAAAWIAGAPEFIAGGYPMSWLFVVAFAADLRWTLFASLLTTGYFAVLHVVMEKDIVRTAGTIMFIVVGVVAGWTFDSLREREELRLQAQREREEAERQLGVQREAATRLQERTEIARQLHDSVLQTLKLISSSADDPDEVRYLTRVQERDLRRTINEYRSPHQDSFRARLLDARAWVEDHHRVEIELVIRDDAEMTPELMTLVEAAKEAMTNAARHSGSPSIDLFAEVRAEGIQVNVRDRGSGFDPATIGTGGIALSIVERMREVGGTAEVNTAPGEGTDVSLFLPHHG